MVRDLVETISSQATPLTDEVFEGVDLAGDEAEATD
jgi:hypothetical protein